MIFVENNSFDMIFMIVFFIIAGTFLFMIVNGISKWHRNNQSPRLTVKAKVVSKRMDVSSHCPIFHRISDSICNLDI